MPVEEGVSQELAIYRKELINNLTYQLKFDIPVQKDSAISATETINFEWKRSPGGLPIDFKETPDHIQKVALNGKEIAVVFEKEHILIGSEYLKEGKNTISIDFTAGDLSLNRNEDYLYTLLVPDRARTVFPCFDQPDLKAKFELTLTVPSQWQAVSNGLLGDTKLINNRKTFQFLPSDILPTYLFSFVAGNFERITRVMAGRGMSFFYRETDASKIRLSLDPIFDNHATAMKFLEDYTLIKFPFQKFDFVAIPDFQYGGMEHAGAIQYKASSLFLDEGATSNQKLSRTRLLAHETAHMWFGNLVTMRWFNDVWMKEVFANFMADKVAQVTDTSSSYDLEFLVSHFPAAYGVDRTEGLNPIGQRLENLNMAGTMYGPIIYHKAPIMMRQLERLMGKKELRDGLREYLSTYKYSNATWADLIGILNARTPTDLFAWNHVWVNETGRPRFDYRLGTREGKITSLTVTQRGEDGSRRLWPQFFEVALVYPNRVEEVTIQMNATSVAVQEAIGKEKPSYVLFNSTGQGYGLFPIDKAMLPKLALLTSPLMRASAYITLFENMLSGREVAPKELMGLYQMLLDKESEELNLRLLTGQMSDIFWQFTRATEREALATVLEKRILKAMEADTNANRKKILFKHYQSIALTKEAQDRLFGIWKDQKAPTGVTLTEDDYTDMALALAVRDYPAKGVLATQLTRIKNPDRQKRLWFMMPALSSMEEERDTFFASLLNEKNRERESWVTGALGYLHHPLRAATSMKYLRPGFDELEEIQKTGDIFFPESWLRATLDTYQSRDAVRIVRQFLAEHPDYNPRLKAKLLQSADGLFRADRLLYREE